MKKLGLIIISVLAFMACEKLNEMATFSLRHTSSFTVPSGSGLNLPLNFPTPKTDVSNSQEFSNNNTRTDLVREVKLTELELEITAPANQDFSFLEAVEIYIESDGLDETLIASLDNIPENVGSSITLETTQANLDDYIKAESFRLNSKVTIREVVNQDVDIDANMRFQVTADLL